MEGNLTCEVESASEVNCNGTLFSSADQSEDMIEPFSLYFWIYLGIYVGLVISAGLASGLTLGLLSLDTTILQVISRGSSDEKERKQAKALLPLVKRHHLLLVTLLLTNAAAVESMPVFLDRLAGPVTAVLVSVTAVLLFGEVIPQAVCSRFGTAIGYYARPLVYFLMAVTFVISWPLAKILDCILGHNHGTYYKRGELGALVDILADDNSENPEPLSQDEKSIIKGALLMRNKAVGDVKYTSLRDVHMLDYDSTFDQDTVNYIINCGHSRLPLFSKRRTNLQGLIITKRLIGCDPTANIPMRDLKLYRGHDIKRVHEKRALFDALNDFQAGEHLAVVTRPVQVKTDTLDTGEVEWLPSTDENDVLGIITLEDILEELLQEPIYDESELKMEVLKSLHISMKSPGNIAASQRGGEDMASSWASRSQRVVRQPMFVRQSSTGKIATPTSKTPLLKRKKSAGMRQQKQSITSNTYSSVGGGGEQSDLGGYSYVQYHYRPSLNSSGGHVNFGSAMEREQTAHNNGPAFNSNNTDREALLQNDNKW